MFGPIRAVAIDDEPSHLLAITTGLTASGIPCTGYWYDRDANELRPPPAEGGHPFLRLILMDLNLAEQAGIPDAATLCSGVMDVLKQIVAKDGGPYLLVFWTLVGTRVSEVANLLYERLEPVEGIPCPISVLELPKRPFIVSDPKQEDWKTALREFHTELHKNIPQLQQTLMTVLTNNPTLNTLTSWESRSADAAGLAVNEIYACAKDDAAEPAKRTESIQKVLAKIAVAASGQKPASISPSRALDAGMIDILIDQFGTSVEDAQYQRLVKDALGPTIEGKVAFQDDGRMFAALNTFFHIDKEVRAAKTWDRGVVIPAIPPLDDKILGFAAQQLVATEFLFNDGFFPGAQRAEIAALWETVKTRAAVVLIELGADCDHAQDKARTRRYLVGLEVPVSCSKLMYSPKNNSLRNGSLQLLGPWNINGQIVHLLVSCRRFWAWQGENPPPAANVKYRLRTSIVNKLLHHYSVWSSRPGIVEFR